MCERIINTRQPIIRHNGMVFVGPTTGHYRGETIMESGLRYAEWIANEVMADHRFPTTACSCNSPDIVEVERTIEIDGEMVDIIANERV